MAHALNEVRSGVRTWPWTLCHGWGPPRCCHRAPWTSQPTWTCPPGPGGHHPAEAPGNAPQRARPGAGLPTVRRVNTPKHRAPPAGPGRRVPPRVQRANHPAVSLWESRPPPLFRGQPQTPSPSLCRGHRLVRMDWPDVHADLDVTGPKSSPQWSERPRGSRQEALLRAPPRLGARANSAFRGAPSTHSL